MDIFELYSTYANKDLISAPKWSFTIHLKSGSGSISIANYKVALQILASQSPKRNQKRPANTNKYATLHKKG